MGIGGYLMSQELILDFLKRNVPKFFTIKEISEQCQLKDSTAYANIKQLESNNAILIDEIEGANFSKKKVYAFKDNSHSILMSIDEIKQLRQKHQFTNMSDIINILCLNELKEIKQIIKEEQQTKVIK